MHTGSIFQTLKKQREKGPTSKPALFFPARVRASPAWNQVQGEGEDARFSWVVAGVEASESPGQAMSSNVTAVKDREFHALKHKLEQLSYMHPLTPPSPP